MRPVARSRCRVTVGVSGLTEAVAREGIPFFVEELAERDYFSDVSARWDQTTGQIQLKLVVSDLDPSEVELELNDDLCDCVGASFMETDAEWDLEFTGVEVLGAV